MTELVDMSIKAASTHSLTVTKSSHSLKGGSKGDLQGSHSNSAENVKNGSADNSRTSVDQNAGDEEVETEPKPFSYIEMLDAPRELPEPLDITVDYLKQISEELGLIKLCWPDLSDVTFEDRTNFPDTYLNNSNKEKLLLLYAENFRRQFCYKFPDRKPLLLACDNECGMQKMVCTTIRATNLPYAEIYTWQDCARFVADHVKYEALEEPILIGVVTYKARSGKNIIHYSGCRTLNQSWTILPALANARAQNSSSTGK